MIIGLGTDIIEIKRIKKVMSKKEFMERFFTSRELEYLTSRREESTAGYFCAKEAVVKALGTGFSGFKWNDVEIIKVNSVPNVVLHNGALEIARLKGVKNIYVSISHCRDYAVSTVVMEG